MKGLWLRVWGLGFRMHRVYEGFKVKSVWLRVGGLGFRIHRVYDGVRVKGAGMIYLGTQVT